MIDRIIDISETAAQLHVRNGLLVIERDNEESTTIPLAEIAALVVAHPRVTFTQSVLSGLAGAGASFITCDERFLPAAMLLPLQAHFVQTERLALQVEASLPTRKRLWKQVVRAKIRAQGFVLQRLHGDDAGLTALAQQVRSGDPKNVEAQASRRYWPLLFADKGFRRDRDAENQNRLLNYGYAILRATVARALCGSGLHPSIGLHHRNRYNPFCLADDIMEPFRPRVDEIVVEIAGTRGSGAALDREVKAELIAGILGRYDMDGDSRTLFDVLSRTASSLVAVLAGERKGIVLPEP